MVLCVAMALCATGCGDDTSDALPPDAAPLDAAPLDAAPADDKPELQAALDDLVRAELDEQNILGLGVTVELADGSVLESSAGRVGPGELDEEYEVSSTKQVIGSITKLYTAVMVMQLVEDGAVSLDDSIDRWISIPRADEITVRMLLNHTSGLNDCLLAMSQEQYAQAWTPAQLVELAVDAGSWAEPGDDYARYSNTNFVLLAMIIEAETGDSWERNLQSRIAEPLGLSHTFYAGEAQGAEHLVDGWFYGEDGWTGSLALIHPSIGWGMGALVATNRELAVFTKALFAGVFFEDPGTLEQMLAFSVDMDPDTLASGEPPQTVGLGVIRYQAEGLQLDGHIGHILGYDTGTFRDPGTGSLITVTSNTDHAVVGLTAVKIAQYLQAR